MRKSAAVPLVVTSSLALALSGCSTGNGSGTSDGSDDAEYQGVCVDQATQQRVDDDECDDDDGRGGSGSGGGFWYYGSRGARIPPIGSAMPAAGTGTAAGSGSSSGSGSPYAGFDRTVPPGSTFVSGGAPADGGTVTPESLRTAASSSSSRVLSATESGSTVRGGLGSGSKAGG